MSVSILTIAMMVVEDMHTTVARPAAPRAPAAKRAERKADLASIVL